MIPPLNLLTLFAAESSAFIDAAQGFVVPVVGAAAGGYALLRIARSDQNWDGLIDGLKSENRRKDELIAQKDEQIAKMTTRLADLAAWEHQREQVLKDLDNEREARRRTLDRLSVKQIELARLQGALSAAGIDPDNITDIVGEYMGTATKTEEDSTESVVGIMLLDDDPLSSALVNDYLMMKRPNWNIRKASSLKSARDVDLHQIDVIITDWELRVDQTDASGYVRYLQENHPTKFILILSSHPPEHVQGLLKMSGCKPAPVFDKAEEAKVRMAGVIQAIDNIVL